MATSWLSNRKFGSLTIVAVLAAGLAGAPQVQAQDEAAPAEESRISGTLSLNWNSHFVSYGQDIWAGGSSWDMDTFNPQLQLVWDLGFFDVILGTWWDINSHLPSSIGSDFQEVDVWVGTAFGLGDFSFTVLFQGWNYAGDVEYILDFIVGYDDSALWGGDFALNPSFTVHGRLDVGAAAVIAGPMAGTPEDEGAVFVFGIAPSFTLLETESFDVNLTIPASVAFFTDEFHGSMGVADGGFGYFAIGAQFSIPLKFIPSSYGDWSINTGVTYFVTDDSVIPGNVDDDFLTGNVGVSCGF